MKDGTALDDGFVEVKFKPISGREDQAGGLVWRWKDGNNYYVARANALENNVSLYYTENGQRRTIKYVDAPVGIPGTRCGWNLVAATSWSRSMERPTSSSTTTTSAGPAAVGVGRKRTV